MRKVCFCCPNFLDELARKRLLRRLIERYLPFEPFFNALQAGSNSRVGGRNFERFTFQKWSLRITLLWCCLIFCKMLFYPSFESADKSKKVIAS